MKRNVDQLGSHLEVLDVGEVRRYVDVVMVDRLAPVVVVVDPLHHLRLQMTTGQNKTSIQTTLILKAILEWRPLHCKKFAVQDTAYGAAMAF